MPVCVNQFAVLHPHAHHFNGNVCLQYMNKPVTDAHGTRQNGKICVNGIKVTHHPVRYGTGQSETPVNSYIYLSPPSADSVRVIKILDHRYDRAETCGHVPVVVHAPGAKDIRRFLGGCRP